MKAFNRILVLLLCCALMCGALAGCGESPDGGDGVSNLTEDGKLPEMDIAGAYASFKPEDVVMTVAGTDVTWQEFFYFINYYINYVKEYSGGVEDWLAEVSSGVTYLDYVLGSALEWRLSLAGIESAAEQAGTLDESAAAAYADEQVAGAKAKCETEDEFYKMLADSYETEELFRAIAESAYYYNQTYLLLFGENGEKLTDEDVAAQTEGDGYMMAKHILLKTTYLDNDGETVNRNEAEKAEIYAKMEGYLAQLDECGEEDFAALFDELMNRFSEDEGGIKYFPEGYLFKKGDMVSEFYDGCEALEIGAHSRIIESANGYHIIYRLPLDYDTVPVAYTSYKYYGYDNYTLRYLTSQQMLSSILSTLTQKVEYTVSDEYTNADYTRMFS